MLKSNNYGSTEPLLNHESDTKTTTKWKTSRTGAIALLLLFTAGAAYFTIHDAAHSSSAVGVNRQYDVEMEEEGYTVDNDIDLDADDDIGLEADHHRAGHKKGGGGKKGGKGKGSKPTKGPKPTKAPKPTKGPKGPKPTAAPPSSSNVVPFSCRPRHGTGTSTKSQTSTVQCLSSETMVSCGIWGWQSIGGVYGIDGDKCIAMTNQEGQSVRAVAQCCTFPSGSNPKAITVSSGTSSVRESATCPSGTAITGCDVYYAGGATNTLIGSYAGPEVSPGNPPQTSQWIDTANRCNAGSRPGASITATAHCLSFDNGYELQCKTKAQFTSKDGYNGCEAGYQQMSCNTWAQITSGSIDQYYMNDLGKCYVQQDDHKPMYANGICCQLTKAGPTPPTTPPPVSSGLRCYTVKGVKPSYKVPADFSRLDAMCPTGIRTGCSAMYTGALADYKGNWGVTASFEEWKPDNDQGCAGGYYGGDNEDQFQVEARCCEDSAGKLGVRIMHGQTKTNVETKFDDGGMCIGTLNEDIDKQGLMYLGCGVSADITMDASGDTWSGSLDPGFGGVRRRPDGTCKGQTFSESATDTCTNLDVQAGKECKDSPTSIIYLDEEDVVYMNSIMHDREKIHEYKQTLIENAGYSVDDEVKFEVEGDDTADWLKADCGAGYWASSRDTEGWQLETISIPKTVNGKTFDCNIVDSDWSIFNNNLGLYESVVGCAKSAGGHDYDYGSLVDCSSFIANQIEECENKGGIKKNYGSYYDDDLCKARSSSPEIRAQAVCCTYK